MLEIFEFQPQQPLVQGPWNRVGLTHFSLNIRDAQKWHDYLKRKGVTIVSEPAKSPNGGQWFFFVKDCDGNLIEMMDLGFMHYVLQWGGPLGGFLFRRERTRSTTSRKRVASSLSQTDPGSRLPILVIRDRL